jgi:hypothetical protein
MNTFKIYFTVVISNLGIRNLYMKIIYYLTGLFRRFICEERFSFPF